MRIEIEIRSRRSVVMTIDFTFKPIRDENSMIRFVVAEGRDISIYKRTSEALHQSRARFATIFNKAGIGIVLEGPDGKITDCNPAFLAMLGYQLGELLSHDYQELTHPLDKAVSRKLFNELVEGKRESYSLEKRYLGKSGQIIWASINASLVRGTDNKARFAIVMAENITAQKQVEAELIELRQRLMQGREMERLQLAQDLHDGPLQEIIGISYQVNDLDNTLQGQVGGEQLQAIKTSLQQVARSIRSFAGELRPSTLIPFGLEKAILSHSEEFRTAHPGVSIELDLAHDGESLPEQVRIALFRIYQEALNNTIRHSEADKVTVRFWLNDGHASLEVDDNGKGFKLPEHWIELARKGHLGLVGSIERARDAGGHLEVTSSSGKGTHLQVVLPVHSEGPGILGMWEKVKIWTPIRVLLVDDHPVVRSGIRALLESAVDIKIAGEATTGADALQLIDEAPADVLLLDMELPDISGTQVAQKVRQNHPGLKVLSLSAHDNSVYVRQVLELGAAGYLLKDEAPQAILDAVRGVAQGQEGWVSRGIAAQMAGWLQPGNSQTAALTRRELEALRLVVQGRTNQAIAAEMKISEKTVEKHIKAIFDKLMVSSRVEAAVTAVREGLVNN